MKTAAKYAATITATALVTLAGLEGANKVGGMHVPYRDIVGVWTDGYGNTKNVVPGVPISEEAARATLLKHVAEFSAGVTKTVGSTTQGQMDAYTLLAYNIGQGAFAKSGTAAAHNAGSYADACLYMLRYDKATFNKVLKVVPGLAKRRYTEYNLCIADLPAGAWKREGKR